MEITKVVIPAAGVGPRFLPFSKTVPREMLPLLNKPSIQHVAEEALLSELVNMIVITAKGKEQIADHFDMSAVNPLIREHDKAGLLASIEKLARMAHFTYIPQQEPLGLGHAVWLARHCINKEYFAVALPDDIIFSKQPALSQLIRVARQEKASVIAVQEVPTECISSYGIVGIRKTITPNLFQLSHVVEKPNPKDAPSSLAVVGRYVLSSKIFNSLDEMQTYEQTELNLTDAICHMMQHNERVFAYKVQGTRYDLGTPLGWIKAVIGSALQDPDYGPATRKFLADINSPDSFLYNPAKIIEHNI
ncbi:UTP--glucose-1-phosphate uridylyltransferase [Candidatus Dependentiae bacterium]|nr:UTP--glucose-1-phosphate uridylyltransferase [Candidatus Dependentiae bacterium]